MKGFLIILAVFSVIISVFLLPGTLASGLWFAPLALGAVLLAIARIIALLEEISMILRRDDVHPCGRERAPDKPQSFNIGGVQYVADPPASKTPPASVDDATIWPDVDDPVIRREIIHAAKLTEQKHVTVRGRVYSVDFKK